MSTDPEKVVFMHIPKTAGVTVNNLISSNYEQQQQFWFTRAGWGEFTDTDQIRYIHGHFDAVTALKLSQGRKLVSFVRDPVARTLSEFYYWKSYTDYYIDSENLAIPRMVKDMRLIDFLTSDIPELHLKSNNFITKAFAGFENTRRKRLVDEEIYDLAVSNFEHFDYVGRVEDMSESIDRLCNLLNLENRYTGQTDNALRGLPDNKHYQAVEREVVTSDICQRLLDNHAYDIRLYRLIAEKFG